MGDYYSYSGRSWVTDASSIRSDIIIIIWSTFRSLSNIYTFIMAQDSIERQLMGDGELIHQARVSIISFMSLPSPEFANES